MSRLDALDLYQESNFSRAQHVINHLPARELSNRLRVRGISVVILNLDKPELIIPLIEFLLVEKSILASEGLCLEIIVGDTGSTNEEVCAFLSDMAARQEIKLKSRLKYNFSANNNELAFELSSCDMLLFLNNDVVFPNASVLLDFYRRAKRDERHGVFGALMYFENGSVQHAGVEFLSEEEVRGLPYHPDARKNIQHTDFPLELNRPATTGAFLGLWSVLFERAGGFDEGYKAECQDIALCLAVIRMGFDVVTYNLGPLLHLENATRPKGEENWKDRSFFLRKWGSFIESEFIPFE